MQHLRGPSARQPSINVPSTGRPPDLQGCSLYSRQRCSLYRRVEAIPHIEIAPIPADTHTTHDTVRPACICVSVLPELPNRHRYIITSHTLRLSYFIATHLDDPASSHRHRMSCFGHSVHRRHRVTPEIASRGYIGTREEGHWRLTTIHDDQRPTGVHQRGQPYEAPRIARSCIACRVRVEDIQDIRDILRLTTSFPSRLVPNPSTFPSGLTVAHDDTTIAPGSRAWHTVSTLRFVSHHPLTFRRMHSTGLYEPQDHACSRLQTDSPPGAGAGGCGYKR